MSKRIFGRFFALVCVCVLLAGASPALAAPDRGKVKDGVFTSPDGVSFTVPDGFTLARLENLNSGFFRVVLEGKRDSHGFSPCIAVEILPGGRDVTKYNALDFMSDMVSDTVTWKYDVFSDHTVLQDQLFQENGRTLRRMFVASRIQRLGETRNCLVRCVCFSTVKSFVRLYYACFGSQQTMIRDLEGLNTLYDTLIVP